MRSFELKYKGYLDSPLGLILIQANGAGLERIDFVEQIEHEPVDHEIIFKAQNQLSEYFRGERKVFDLMLFPQGTHFQRNVWDELLKVPYGVTRSYEDIARKLGDIKVIRAAASANGKNPLAIVVPCHRVIGKDGSLTGYSGGLWRKKWLLQLEQKDSQPQLL
jgi:methylated-DNA-[protein]-cysteine S-methyltransferase